MKRHSPQQFISPERARPGRSITTLVAAALLCLTGALTIYAGPQLDLGTASGAPGATAVLPLTFHGSSSLVAAQFDLRYSVPSVTGQAPAFEPPLPDLIVAAAQLSGGIQRVLIYSRSGSAWPDTVQLSIPCAIAANAVPGNASVTVVNALLSDAQAKPVAADHLGSGTISIVGGVGPRFQFIQVQPDETVKLQFTGDSGRAYVLQTSPDLRVWLPVQTNAAVLGIVVVTNRPSARQLFYRAALLP